MKKIVFISLILFTNLAVGAEFDNKEQVIDVSGKFIQLTNKGEYQKAFDLAAPYWPIPKHEVDGIVYNIKGKISQIEERFGPPLDAVHVKNQVIGDIFYKRIYIQKYANHALVWSLSFYKPKQKWVVNEILFHDRISSLYECEKANKKNTADTEKRCG